MPSPTSTPPSAPRELLRLRAELADGVQPLGLESGALDGGAGLVGERTGQGQLGGAEIAGGAVVDVQAADAGPTGRDGNVHG